MDRWSEFSARFPRLGGAERDEGPTVFGHPEGDVSNSGLIVVALMAIRIWRIDLPTARRKDLLAFSAAFGGPAKRVPPHYPSTRLYARGIKLLCSNAWSAGGAGCFKVYRGQDIARFLLTLVQRLGGSVLSRSLSPSPLPIF